MHDRTHMKRVSLAMHQKYVLFFLPLLLPLNIDAHASQTCASTVSELGVMFGNQIFPRKWEETTMDDGKPLVMSIVENNGSILLAFTKAGEGLWAESVGDICKKGTDFEARFSGKQIRLGPAANWILRNALRNGGKFTLTKLGSDQLRIATSSWSGTFSPTEK
ncbi:MAG: hypothetical protein Q7T90_07290 [Thiobacillus sp.]|nr:hypothetical protein [Thiobacillus sp.]